ncbi:MAG: hypothetical protein R2873_21465 [Caldilineaceae bacterium]
MRLPTWTQSSFAALRRILPAQKIGRAVDVICGIDSHNDTPDTRRIHHLLGMAIGSAIFICLFFAYHYQRSVGKVDINLLVMLGAAVWSLVNLVMLAQRRSLRTTVLLFLGMAYVMLTYLNYHNGGLDAPAISFYFALPLFATFLLGTRDGVAITSLISTTFVVFFAMAESGFVFPRALPEEVVQWFRLLSLASVLGYIAMIAWFFEMLRRTSMQQVNSTMDQLKLLNQELIQARDDAHAAAQAKSAFRLTA